MLRTNTGASAPKVKEESKMKSNSGGVKAPSPKSKMIFPGLRGLVASGAGMTKKVDHLKLRPEGAVHIDAGNLKPASGTKKMAAGSPKMISGSGHKGIHVGVRPEGPIKRDAGKVVKP